MNDDDNVNQPEVWEVDVDSEYSDPFSTGGIWRVYPKKGFYYKTDWSVPVCTRFRYRHFHQMFYIKRPKNLKNLKKSIILCQIWCNEENQKKPGKKDPDINALIIEAKQTTGALTQNHDE